MFFGKAFDDMLEECEKWEKEDMEDFLEDKVKVRSVNFSVEEKLDKIIELLEKLAPQPVTINSPITIKSEEGKDVGVDISKHLYELVNKVEKKQKAVGVGQEEFIKRLNKVDWDKLVESFGVLPDNSLETAVKKNLLSKVKDIPYVPIKVNLKVADERGNISDLVGHVQEDGSIICEPFVQDRTIIGWVNRLAGDSLGK